MQTSTLKPGLLVALNTSVRGGIRYDRRDLAPATTTTEGALVSTWETTREIPDPAEYESATVARNAARATIARVCCASSFGLLCPTTKAQELADAIDEARKICNEHNATARLTRVSVYALVGRIAQDDAEAARAIGAELSGMLDEMQAGIKAADPDRIRDAATKARAIEGMLAPEIAGQVSAAILEARAAARALVKRVGKAGESAADVVAELSVQKIKTARFSFLDLDEQQPAAQQEAPAGRAVEFSPDAPAPQQAAAPRSFELELS